MKQYLLAVLYPEGSSMPPPEELAAIQADVEAFHEEVQAAGAWVFGGGLHPASLATVVQVTNGEVVTTDGPYAETKEQLGGFSIVKAPDLDAALLMAAKASAATRCPIEVRPFVGDAE
jgi:hypothetical protein